MEGWWRGDDDDDGDDFPLTGGQFSLQISSPGKNRGLRRLRDVDGKSDSYFDVSSMGEEIGVHVGHQGVWDPPRRVGGAARSSAAPGTLLAAPWLPCGPPLVLRKLPES